MQPRVHLRLEPSPPSHHSHGPFGTAQPAPRRGSTAGNNYFPVYSLSFLSPVSLTSSSFARAHMCIRLTTLAGPDYARARYVIDVRDACVQLWLETGLEAPQQ
jgi:hypothetical protein